MPKMTCLLIDVRQSLISSIVARGPAAFLLDRTVDWQYAVCVGSQRVGRVPAIVSRVLASLERRGVSVELANCIVKKVMPGAGNLRNQAIGLFDDDDEDELVKEEWGVLVAIAWQGNHAIEASALPLLEAK